MNTGLRIGSETSPPSTHDCESSNRHDKCCWCEATAGVYANVCDTVSLGSATNASAVHPCEREICRTCLLVLLGAMICDIRMRFEVEATAFVYFPSKKKRGGTYFATDDVYRSCSPKQNSRKHDTLVVPYTRLARQTSQSHEKTSHELPEPSLMNTPCRKCTMQHLSSRLRRALP